MRKKVNYLSFWVLGIMVIVLIGVLVSLRWNQTIRASAGCFLGLLLVTSFAENDCESFGWCGIVHIPFPKLWQWLPFVSLYQETEDSLDIKTARHLLEKWSSWWSKKRDLKRLFVLTAIVEIKAKGNIKTYWEKERVGRREKRNAVVI